MICCTGGGGCGDWHQGNVGQQWLPVACLDQLVRCLPCMRAQLLRLQRESVILLPALSSSPVILSSLGPHPSPLFTPGDNRREYGWPRIHLCFYLPTIARSQVCRTRQQIKDLD